MLAVAETELFGPLVGDYRDEVERQEFAELLGVSPRTLQDWEQGWRHPTRSAQTLLKIADRHPEVLRSENCFAGVSRGGNP